MKNLTKLFLGLLILTGIVFTGCKEASELVDVKFAANYETELNVAVTPSTTAKVTNGVFAVTKTIDPTTNSDYEKYLNNIKGVNITSVSGLILSVNPDMTLLQTNLSITNGTRTATWTYDNLSIVEGTIITLDNNNGQWDEVEQMLMEKEPFTVSLSGTASEENADFVVLISFESEVTANPIN